MVIIDVCPGCQAFVGDLPDGTHFCDTCKLEEMKPSTLPLWILICLIIILILLLMLRD